MEKPRQPAERGVMHTQAAERLKEAVHDTTRPDDVEREETTDTTTNTATTHEIDRELGNARARIAELERGEGVSGAFSAIRIKGETVGGTEVDREAEILSLEHTVRELEHRRREVEAAEIRQKIQELQERLKQIGGLAPADETERPASEGAAETISRDEIPEPSLDTARISPEQLAHARAGVETMTPANTNDAPDTEPHDTPDAVPEVLELSSEEAEAIRKRFEEAEEAMRQQIEEKASPEHKQFLGSLLEKYRKLTWKQKLAISGGLLAVGTLTGGLAGGALAGGAAVGGRVLGGIGAFSTADLLLRTKRGSKGVKAISRLLGGGEAKEAYVRGGAAGVVTGLYLALVPSFLSDQVQAVGESEWYNRLLERLNGVEPASFTAQVPPWPLDAVPPPEPFAPVATPEPLAGADAPVAPQPATPSAHPSVPPDTSALPDAETLHDVGTEEVIQSSGEFDMPVSAPEPLPDVRPGDAEVLQDAGPITAEDVERARAGTSDPSTPTGGTPAEPSAEAPTEAPRAKPLESAPTSLAAEVVSPEAFTEEVSAAFNTGGDPMNNPNIRVFVESDFATSMQVHGIEEGGSLRETFNRYLHGQLETMRREFGADNEHLISLKERLGYKEGIRFLGLGAEGTFGHGLEGQLSVRDAIEEVIRARVAAANA